MDADWAIGFARLQFTGVRVARLGYAVPADHWGNGYATDAARTLCTFVFNRLDLHRITVAIGPDNETIDQLIEAIGSPTKAGLAITRMTSKVVFEILDVCPGAGFDNPELTADLALTEVDFVAVQP